MLTTTSSSGESDFGYIPAGHGFIDDKMNKADRNPPKKHGNIPL